MKVPARFSKIEKCNSERSSKPASRLSILSMVSWIVGCAPCAQSSTGESSVQLAITAAFTAGASSATAPRRYRRSVSRLREIGTFASEFKLLPLSQRVSLSSGAKLHIRARAGDICQVDYRVVGKRKIVPSTALAAWRAWWSCGGRRRHRQTGILQISGEDHLG